MKKRAAEAEKIRKCPEKVYANVKSRIAGNMKSQKKAKKTAKKIERNLEEARVHFNGASPDKAYRYSPTASPSPKKGSARRAKTANVSPERLN